MNRHSLVAQTQLTHYIRVITKIIYSNILSYAEMVTCFQDIVLILVDIMDNILNEF